MNFAWRRFVLVVPRSSSVAYIVGSLDPYKSLVMVIFYV